MQTIDASTLSFLRKLELNNNREWFGANKEKYLTAQQNMIDFVEALSGAMNKHDELDIEPAKKSLYRIYSDVRFSKDKSPYNVRFAFSFRRATKYKRGGYYVHIKPGNSYLSCGFFGPNPEDLRRIRLDIDHHYTEWNRILRSKSIKGNFGTLRGEQVKSAPRGFTIEHPAIELLRYKQFILRHEFSDKEVLAPGFAKEVNRIFKSVRPYFDHMSLALTTDLNGEYTI